jgi:hypothetical protein
MERNLKPPTVRVSQFENAAVLVSSENNNHFFVARRYSITACLYLRLAHPLSAVDTI